MADDAAGSAVPEYSAKWWMKEIELAEKHLDDKWRMAADRVVNRYLDVRDDDTGFVDTTDRRRYNIFWANVQITKSALYATPPKPVIKRMHDDAKDDVARTAALILERIVNFGFTDQDGDMHEAFQMSMEDLLIPGLGQVWLRYGVETEPMVIPAVTDPATGQVIKPEEEGLKIVDESAPTDYVHWRDFLYSVTRTWGEVWWVGRRCWMKKKAFVKRFGQEKWDEVKSAATEARHTTLPKGFTKGRAEVFEVWCEDSNTAYWINRHCDELLDEKSDPLQLEGFYPCPQPVLATHTTNSFVPRSDYTMVADQYEELDILNSRISILTKALRVVGVYDASNTELKQLLSGGEFNMIGIANWEVFVEKKGLSGQVDWFPVEVIAEVLGKLTEQRIAIINQIYELTSISDIMRGASNPRDTLGAQKLKAQYSSVRLQLKQQDVAKFVRNAIRLKCEIICRHWQPETIRRVSKIEFTESSQYADQAIALLKQAEEFEYRVEIGEETLSIADYNAERELRTEVLTSIGQFLSQAAGMMEAYPAATPQLFKMIQWVVSSFRGSSDIETVLDEAIRTAQANPPQKAGPPPDHTAEELQAKTAMHQASEQSKLQLAQLGEQSKQAIASMNNETTLKVAEMNNSTKLIIEQMAQALEAQVKNADLAQEQNRMALEQVLARSQQAHEAMMGMMDSEKEEKAAKDDDVKALVTELMQTMKKKRIRIPVYGKDGAITKIEDSLEN